MKRRLGDRYDGKKLRHADLFFRLEPYIMRGRNDAHVYATERVDVTHTREYINQRRRETGEHIHFIDVAAASTVRALSQIPQLNRFIAGRKAYQRNDIVMSLALKRSMSLDGEETTIKMHYDRGATLADVSRQLREKIAEGKKEGDTETDRLAKRFYHLPGWLIGFLVLLLRALDFFGWMPKFANEASPFHCSFFITDMGSIGFSPVYHHIYNFGNCGVFYSFGPRKKEYVLQKDGSVEERLFIEFKIVADERICDGFTMASSVKLFTWYLQHPELLEKPPEKIVEDPCL